MGDLARLLFNMKILNHLKIVMMKNCDVDVIPEDSVFLSKVEVGEVVRGRRLLCPPLGRLSSPLI